MLQLLLEGGERYEDLAALLGVSAEQVRSRAASAVAERDTAGLEAIEPLSDYLLGQAEPAAIEAIESRLTANPDELASVRRLHARLRLLCPAADLPALPGADRVRATVPAGPRERSEETVPDPTAPTTEARVAAPEPTASAAEAKEAAPEPTETAAEATEAEREPLERPSLNTQQKRLLALLVGSALVILVTVLALTGVFSGDASTDPGAGEAAAARTDTASEDTPLTRAVLKPQGEGDGAGVAIFGAVDEETPVLQVTARNLAPTKRGEEYSVWLYKTDEIALRLAGLEVGRNGRIATQIELPAEALNFIVDGTLNQVDISLDRKRAYEREVEASQDEGRLPRRIGTSILRGRITGPGLGTSPAGNQ